ncbi:hypothetical protein AVEN_9980-1 [Araneus ventricosus]|uniref:Uncharacterized protein n=1 Tax=Araneus ventricosus TaxID=182803 RepID=A0A4Y2FBE1_ARAVE|nr:hypothetical protein AVEN_9980-1 [Araneus ventricosus]
MRTRRVSRQNLASLWDIRGWIKKSYKGIYLNAGPASQQITPAPPLLQRKSPNPSTTYAEVTKKHQASKKPPTLLLYPMKSAEKEEVLEILKREIARPSIKIKDVQKIKNKGVAVQLERDQDVEELIQTINSLLEEAVLVTIPLESADHLRWSASIVLCTTNSTEQGFLPITTHPTAAAPATWESTTTTAIDIIQINLAKSKVATAHLEKLASEININHFLVQEPYVKEGKIAGVPRKWHQWLSSNNKAEIISLPSTNSPIFICSTTNLTAIKIPAITGPVNLISAYSSPYAELQDTAQGLANLF